MEWKDIEKLDGKFSVSDTGLLRNNKTGKILKQNLFNRKYRGAVVKPNGNACCHQASKKY